MKVVQNTVYGRRASFTLPKVALKKYRELGGEDITTRYDPILIQIVEEFGNSIDNKKSKLIVVDVGLRNGGSSEMKLVI
jgi:hypothetical protein